MGSQISPVLSNLFAEPFEKRYLNTTFGVPVVWYRYVDDIFAVIPEDNDVENILGVLNSYVLSIKFTLKMERGEGVWRFGCFVKMGA